MKRVQKSGKYIGSTLGRVLGTILGFIIRLFINCLDMLSIFLVVGTISSIMVGYPSSSQIDIRETIVAVLYIILRILGDLIQNRVTK